MWWKLSSFLTDHDIPKNIKTQAQRAEITQAAKLKVRNRFEEKPKICQEHQNSLQKSASDEIKSYSEEANKKVSSSISSMKLSADSAILQAKKSAEQEISRILESVRPETLTSIIEIDRITPSLAIPSTSFITLFQSLPPISSLGPAPTPSSSLSSSFSQAESPTSSTDTSPILPSLPPQTQQPVLETSTSQLTCNDTFSHSMLHSVVASPSLFASIFISWTILSGLISATICYLIFDHFRSRKEKITGSNDPTAETSNINQRLPFWTFSSDRYNDKAARKNFRKMVIDNRASENGKSHRSLMFVLSSSHPRWREKIIDFSEIQVGLAIESHESKSRNSLDISPNRLERPGNMSELSKKTSMTWFPASEQPIRNTVEWLDARNKYLLDASKRLYVEQNTLKNTVDRDPGQNYWSNLVIEGSSRNSNVGKAI